MEKLICIAGVRERDVDLLLLEEFFASPAFAKEFVAIAFGRSMQLGEFVCAKRGVTDASGESDLEVDFMTSEGHKTRLLIENKIKAGLQKDQAVRYRERAEGYTKRGECQECFTIIAAPQRYFGSAGTRKRFDKRVTYEELLKWFGDPGNGLGGRADYKKALLQCAIEKGTLGYEPVIDAPASTFWQEYYKLAGKEYRELDMNQPGQKPSGSGFIYFRPKELQPWFEICHKFRKCHVDLHIKGMADRINDVKAVLGECLTQGTRKEVCKAGKSAAIRVQTAKLSSQVPFEDQVEDAASGLRAAKELYEWYMQNKEAFGRLMEVMKRDSHGGEA